MSENPAMRHMAIPTKKTTASTFAYPPVAPPTILIQDARHKQDPKIIEIMQTMILSMSVSIAGMCGGYKDIFLTLWKTLDPGDVTGGKPGPLRHQ